MSGGRPKPKPEPEERECANPDCFAFFEVKPKRQKFCSRDCQRHVAKYKMNLAGAKAAGDKRRGTGKGYIYVNVNGKSQLQHRVIYAEYMGRELLPFPEEIVHHKDRDKKHNCVPGRILCGNLFCEGNLELLSGDAARRHIRLHFPEMYKARYGVDYNPNYEPTPEELAERERQEAYYADNPYGF